MEIVLYSGFGPSRLAWVAASRKRHPSLFLEGPQWTKLGPWHPDSSLQWLLPHSAGGRSKGDTSHWPRTDEMLAMRSAAIGLVKVGTKSRLLDGV